MFAAATRLKAPSRKPVVGEVINLISDGFRSNWTRFVLTGLAIAAGTASLILVAAVGAAGRQYLLTQIQSIGSNEIWAEYQSGPPHITQTVADFLTIEDMQAVRAQVAGIIAATPVVTFLEKVPFLNGKERDISVLGVHPDYWTIRNMIPVSGRFFDTRDEGNRSKACVITQNMAQQIYGSPEVAIGKIIKLSGIPFTVNGTFRERVDTFGRTEVTDDTMVIPYSVSRYLSDYVYAKMLYFSVASPSMVVPATAQIRNVIGARHRPESVYTVENLSRLVQLANIVTKTLTVILLAVAVITLLVGGVGIMNIMLVTVDTRVHEIGIRRAVGATARDIRFQFLYEALAISVGGGLIGTLVGFGVPLAVRWTTEYRIPLSGLSAAVGIAVSSLVGVIFGTFPAMRAAALDPAEILRYE